MKLWRGKIGFAGILLMTSLLSISLFTGCQPDKKEESKAVSLSRQTRVKYRSSGEVVPKERRVEVIFKVGTRAPQSAKDVQLWLPYPVSNDNQSIEDVRIEGNYSYNGIYTEGEFGNHILYARWDNPRQEPILTVAFKAKSREVIRKDFEDKQAPLPPEVKKFLEPSDLVPVRGRVKKICNSITKGKRSDLRKAIAIYDYVVEKTERDETVAGCGTGNVRALLDTRKGKCVDLHSIFVALARSAGIPAREVLGIGIPKEPEGDMTKAYHCRAEFYLAGFGWVPVDPSRVRKLILKENLTLNDAKVKEKRDYYFGSWDENYIMFGTGRDLRLNPPQKGNNLNYFMYPYAEVDGQALNWLDQKDLVYSVTYRDI